MANNIANAILQSIDILTEDKLRKMKLDRTVQAKIAGTSHFATDGYYDVLPIDSDSYLNAYYNGGAEFEVGTEVYVTIPQNDRNLKAWIIGSVGKVNKDNEILVWDDTNQYIKVTDDIKDKLKDNAWTEAVLKGGVNSVVVRVNVNTYNRDTTDAITIIASIKKDNQDTTSEESAPRKERFVINFNKIEGILDNNIKDDTILLGYTFDLDEGEYIESLTAEESNSLTIAELFAAVNAADYNETVELKLTNSQTDSTRKDIATSDEKVTLTASLIFNGVNLSESTESGEVKYKWLYNDKPFPAGSSSEFAAAANSLTVPLNKLYLKQNHFTCQATYSDKVYMASSIVTATNLPEYYIKQTVERSLVTLSVGYRGESDQVTGDWWTGEDYSDTNKWKFIWKKDGEDIAGDNNYIYHPVYHSIGEPIVYTCELQRKNPYAGEDLVTLGILEHSLEALGELSPTAREGITITRGDSIFVWDEADVFKNGEITLSIKGFDKNGVYLGDSADSDDESLREWLAVDAKHPIKWYLPSDNSMIEVVDKNDSNVYEGNTLKITGGRHFDWIDASNANNQIRVEVPVKPAYFNQDTITTYTTLSFTQQGLPGTNGSRYIVRPFITYGKRNEEEEIVWEKETSLAEYGFLVEDLYFKIDLKVWNVELNQWLATTDFIVKKDKFTYGPINIATDIDTTDNHKYYYYDESGDRAFNNNILLLTATVDNKDYFTFLPIVTCDSASGTLKDFQNCLSNPFFYVVYDSSLKNAIYRHTDNYIVNSSRLFLNNGGSDVVTPQYLELINDNKSVSIKNKIFDGNAKGEILGIQGKLTYYIPIVFTTVTSLQNFIGGWDGNSAQVGDDYIISPIAAFGKKDDENKFTGLVLGQSKGADSWNQTFTLSNLRLPNGTTYGDRWIVCSGETFTPKQTHILEIVAFGDYNFSAKGESNPYVVLSQDQPYSDNDPDRWLYLFGVSDEVWANLITNYQNAVATIKYNNETTTGSITITETNDVLGMVAYANNERTFTLDANTGKAVFGKSNKGQIVIDPETEQAAIYGGNFKYNKGASNDSSGMMINLTEPGIYWGNGNFQINSEGELTAKAGSFAGNIEATTGKIAEFYIKDSNLIGYNNGTPTVGLCSTSGVDYAFWAGEDHAFQVDHAGFLTATKGQIGNFTIANGNLTGGSGTDSIKLIPASGMITFASDTVQLQGMYIPSTEQIVTVRLNNSVFNSTYNFSTQKTDYRWDLDFRISSNQYAVNNSRQVTIIITSQLANASKVTLLNQTKKPSSTNEILYSDSVTLFGSSSSISSDLLTYTLQINNKTIFSATMPALYGSRNSYQREQIMYNESQGGMKEQRTISTVGSFTPRTDNNYSLGYSGYRWSQVWATTGTIQTSDQNEKNSIETLPSSYLTFFGKLNPVRYKFNQNTSNRYHAGLIAQEVEEALQESNISTQDFAGFISYDKEDGDKGYGLRYEEFIALLIAKVQQQDKEIKEMRQLVEKMLAPAGEAAAAQSTEKEENEENGNDE